MRNPPHWAEIKPVAVRMNVLRDNSLSIEFFLLYGSSRRFRALRTTDCKERPADGFGLGMQRRLYLLVAELVEGIGFVRTELMT
jgi:hypothetical protein